jgi:hypothetical protein
VLFSIGIGIAAFALLWLLGRLLMTNAPARLAHAIRWVVAIVVGAAIVIFVYAGRWPLAAALLPAFVVALLRWRPAQDDEVGRMPRAEALRLLGLVEGASDDDIRDAHRRLMVRIHPDRGGSTFLAAKINEARDALLRRG